MPYRIRQVIAAVAAIVAVQAAASEFPVGVAIALDDGEICMSLPSPAAAVGTSVTLIQLVHPQTAAVVIVERSVSNCAELARAGIAGPYYYLAKRLPDSAREIRGVSVTINGTPLTRETAGVVRVRLNAKYPNAQVRSCTSMEGLHLTIWAGPPLRSLRLWHRYFYLGYDTEPTCEKADFAD